MNFESIPLSNIKVLKEGDLIQIGNSVFAKLLCPNCRGDICVWLGAKFVVIECLNPECLSRVGFSYDLLNEIGKVIQNEVKKHE